MKLISIFLISFSFTFSAFSQTAAVFTTEAADSTNVYYKSLSDFCKYVDRVFPNVGTIYIEKSTLNTWLPVRLGKFKIVFIDEVEAIKLQKRTKSKFYLTRIVPIRAEKDYFFINVIPFRVEVAKKRELKLINSGAIQSRFNYNCNNGEFSYLGVAGNGFSELQ